MAKSVYEQSGYRYRRYQKPSSSRKKKIAVLAAALAAFIGVAVWLQGNVTDLLYSLSEATVRAAMAASVNDALAETLEWNAVDYDSLVTITRDAENNVLGIEADAQQLNLLARQTTTLSMAKLNAACAQGVRVPLGAFTGIDWLAGYGPHVTFSIIPVGAVQCEYASSFTSAGVNQTLHTILLKAKAAVSVVMPGRTQEISLTTSAVICENVIVGKVPDIYLHGAGNFAEGGING